MPSTPQTEIRRFLRRLGPLVALLFLAGCGGVPHGPTASREPAAIVQANLPPVHPPSAATAGPKRIVKVGLLLPLSGDATHLGSAMLDAAMLGLFDKYNSLGADRRGVEVVLLPKDTGHDAKTAELAAKSAIADGASLILGPLYADSVKSVLPIAAKAGIPVISFSNNPAIAAPDLYLYGFLPQQQVTRVAGEAYHEHLEHLAAILPANAYGKLVAKALEQSAAEQGKRLTGIEYYTEGGDIGEAADRLFAAAGNGQKPAIDAVLLAEGGEPLKAAVGRLKRYGAGTSGLQLLGTGLWDDPALLADPDLAGGMFAGSPVRQTRSFESHFTGSYHYTPPRLASLAYDAVTFTVTLAMQAKDGRFTSRMIENPSGFAGPANGIFRFRGSLSERGLAVLKIEPRGFTEISPAPRSFGER